MSARDHLRLGPDGKYVWVENPDEESSDGTAPNDVQTQGKGQSLTNISSSMSGPGIGDDVAAKRASLLHAQGNLQVGRRESPEPYDPWPKRRMYIRGGVAVVVVILIVIAIALFLGTDYSIA